MESPNISSSQDVVLLNMTSKCCPHIVNVRTIDSEQWQIVTVHW